MVSQDLVQQVMEKLNKPCNSREITQYIIDNKLSDNKRTSLIVDVSYNLNRLRTWEIITKYPDLHGQDSNKWYIIKDNKPHDSKNCKYCKGIVKAHNKNISQYIIRSTNRKMKLTEDEEDIVFKDEEL